MNLFHFLDWLNDSPGNIILVLFGGFACLWLAVFLYGLVDHMTTEANDTAP